ncbi:hypothetical protein MFIFM68171_01956 [Madurella fahalii]|uniref:Uncharacterized protein n=1 Tax=Madurella fahalii TaxID=1157608 RepID=A0ABQ0G1V5_9PEZI
MDQPTARRRADMRQWPFYDENLMVGPPACSERDFIRPLLRRCPFDLNTISWIARLGGGLDGFAWKVMFGDQGPFVLKVVHTEPPTTFGFYYAAQRESMNAALLEKIEAAVSHDTETLPIRVHAEPRTPDDALDNLLALSTEDRQSQLVKDADAVEISSIPRMKKCFRWLKIDGEQLCNLHRRLRSVVVKLRNIEDRQIFPDRKYFSIVYEYIPEGDNYMGQMQLVLDFLWRAGFVFRQSLRKENWKSGVLVDLSDVISPGGHNWHKNAYRRTDASFPVPADALIFPWYRR